MNFNYNLPVNLIFGRGRINEIGEIVKSHGNKAIIVTGRNSTKKSGLLDRVIENLRESEIDCVVFDRVPQNPLTTTAIDAAKMITREECNVVIGLGGGSIMDCAKASAFLAVNQGDINDYIFGKKSSDKALSLVLVPTTCGTGSEGNGFAVLTNPESGDKKSLRCNAIVAKASIIDSTLMETMPKSVLASVGFDALCHLMESYISNISQPLTDIICLEGMRMVNESLVDLYEDNGSDEKWDKLTLASTLGGMVINTAGVTLPHGLEHPVSGLKDAVHGKGLAALTPAIMKKTIKGNEGKFKNIVKCFGGKNENEFNELLLKIIDKLNLKVTLTDLGIKKKDVEWLVENALKVSAPSIKNHPVSFSKDEIRELYMECL